MFTVYAFIGNLTHINSMGKKNFMFEVFVMIPKIEKNYTTPIMGTLTF